MQLIAMWLAGFRNGAPLPPFPGVLPFGTRSHRDLRWKGWKGDNSLVATLIGGFGWRDQNGTNQDQRLGGSKERKRAVGAIRVMQGQYVIALLLQFFEGDRLRAFFLLGCESCEWIC